MNPINGSENYNVLSEKKQINHILSHFSHFVMSTGRPIFIPYTRYVPLSPSKNSPLLLHP